jgi:hypothetical protein
LREQFYDALNHNEGELYAIVRSLTDLDAAFKHYNELAQTTYDWEGAVSSEVIAEYAQFVGKPGQWLLASELAILAEVFQIRVEYYSAPGAKVEVFNPGQQNKVVVQFNGVNHFEQVRLAPQQPNRREEKKGSMKSRVGKNDSKKEIKASAVATHAELEEKKKVNTQCSSQSNASNSSFSSSSNNSHSNFHKDDKKPEKEKFDSKWVASKNNNAMFSRLVFTVNGEEIEFDSHELIHIAHEVVSTLQAQLVHHKVELPDYEAVDQLLDKGFWNFTYSLADGLERSYDLQKNDISKLLVGAYNNPLYILKYSSLLNSIKEKQKTRFSEIQVGQHIAIPMQLIQMKTINQWLYMAKYFADNYLSQESMSGWWLKIGGRVIRLRNDVENGVLAENNKQFYVSDHGFEYDITTNTRKEIHRCIQSFTWGDQGGTYFRAFKFWQYFNLRTLRKELKYKFIESATDDILKNNEKCRGLFLSLEKPSSLTKPPSPQIDHLSKEKHDSYIDIFKKTLTRLILDNGQYFAISKTDEDWIKCTFVLDFTDEIAKSPEACKQLLIECFRKRYEPVGIVPYEKLPKKVREERGKKFDKIFETYLEQHQFALKKEFIANLNDEISTSPQKCQLLLISLAHANRDFRGNVDENRWRSADVSNLGSRGRIDAPELLECKMTESQTLRYGAIFDDLVKQFNYVTEAILQQRVEFIKDARNPFHTQIKQIMHEDDANNYIMVHVLRELAKKINHGTHEPLFPVRSAYGDRDSGDSYHEFELSVSEYLTKPGALSEPNLAKAMRDLLIGEPLIDDNLGFLPCLTAAWFIAETARNSLIGMTSLMLLDMLENRVKLDAGGGKNWYCWRHVLIHPEKGTEIGGDTVGEVKNLYGQLVGVDEFGGCHPMAHRGSVDQTKDLPAQDKPLTIAFQINMFALA